MPRNLMENPDALHEGLPVSRRRSAAASVWLALVVCILDSSIANVALPTVAHDSGLAVDALNGMPGVFSARWAGRHGDDAANLELVLAQVSDVPDPLRGAAFVCAAALVLPDGRDYVTHGRLPGRLIRKPRGDGGFGYDPIFVADGHTRTNAELTPEEKDAISHRGQAFRALAAIVAREVAT